MSTYEKKYDLTDKEAADVKAIQDIKDYLGDNWDRLLAVITYAIADGSKFVGIEFLCSFAGVQGYPIHALCRHICKLTGQSLPEGMED